MNLSGVTESKRAVVAAMSKDPLFFMKTVAPWLFDEEFGPVHHAIIRDLPLGINNKYNRVYREITEIIVPRGRAKSTVVTEMCTLWMVLFDGKKHIPISSVTSDTSERFLDTIARVVESDEFKFYFGNCVGSPWNKYELVLKNEALSLHARIASYGVGQSVVGLNWLGNRPDVWVLDDIENSDTVRSIKQVEEREHWIYTVVMPAMRSGKSPVIFIGTPYSADCVLTRVANNKLMTRVIRYPALVETQQQSLRLGVPIGHSIWECKFPTAEVVADREKHAAAGKLASWNLSYMLKASAAKVRGFENIAEYQSGELRGKDLKYYILCDFAYSRKASADPAAIAVLAIDTSSKNKVYDVECHEGQWGDVGTIAKLSELIRKYAPISGDGEEDRLVVGIESYSFDMVRKLIYESLATVDMRNVSIVQLKPDGRSKVSRIQALIPYCDTERFLVKSDNVILKAQMSRFDGLTDKNLNLLDCVSYILDFLFRREPKKTPEEERHEAWIQLEAEIDGMILEDGGYEIMGAMEDSCF